MRHRAERIVVATGGWPVPADVPGGELAISSNEIFDLARFPKRLVVVGGGYIACEFASIFNGLGARGDAALSRRADPARLRRRRARLRRRRDEEEGRRHPRRREGAARSSAAATARRGSSSATAARSRPTPCSAPPAARRTPPASASRRSASRSTPTARSSSTTRYRSNVPSIYAIGDVIDRVQLTPVALAEAMALVDDLFGGAGAQRRLPAHPDGGLHPSQHRHDRPLRGRRARPLRARSASTAPSSSRCATRSRAAASEP